MSFSSIVEPIRTKVSVAFQVLLSLFSILLLGVISTRVYYPQQKNRKETKIIPKIDETFYSDRFLGDLVHIQVKTIAQKIAFGCFMHNNLKTFFWNQKTAAWIACRGLQNGSKAN